MRITFIVDLQFGSTGKGLMAGYIAKRDAPDTIVTSWASNAGHTFIDSDGRKFIHTMLANGVVSCNLKQILIGPGSLIDPVNLLAELTACKDLVADRGVQVMIHPNAAVVLPHHSREEAAFSRIGSTQKGVGAAAIQRIVRDPENQNIAGVILPGTSLGEYVVAKEQYEAALHDAECVLVEGAQGHSLSMYHGFYPYCTSRDVSVAQMVADGAIPFDILRRAKVRVIGTARTYPIRVNNKTGTSGPGYADQDEVSFEALGLPVELTTVTKLPRRIFTFSPRQIADAVRQNGVDEIFLNFANYCNDPQELNDLIGRIHGVVHNDCAVAYLGWGPTVDDVEDLKSALNFSGTRNYRGVPF